MENGSSRSNRGAEGRPWVIALAVALMGALHLTAIGDAAMGLTGGPDAFGYTFVDSNEPGGPAYNFEDISTTGTPIVLGDDVVSSIIAVGFSFEFYGATYSSIYISSNGFLTVLASQSSGCCSGVAMPNGGSPNGIISAWWEDILPAAGGTIHYETLGSTPNQRFIVQFTNVPHFPSSYPAGSPSTFQFKLFEGESKVEVHYQSALSDGGQHSAGIENTTGTVGLQYAFQTTALSPSLAVRYLLCDGDGVIDAGEQCDDNNLDDGDGCNSACRIETCWTCANAPSVCTPQGGGTPCPDDGDVCTSDVCDGAGLCIHPGDVVSGTPCPDDGDVCTSDVCDGSGLCIHPGDVTAGTPCPDDGSVCTTDACDGAGTCAHTQLPDGSPCPDDNSLCTGDVCNAGICSHPSVVDCNLVNQCHEPGSCDPSTGTCTYCPAGYTAGGGGCQKTYPIDVSLLDNLLAQCSGPDDLYNNCNGSFGFHWTDTGDGSVGAVIGADLLINAGVDCSGTSRAVSLNGNGVGSYATSACACPAPPEPRLLSAIDVSSYVKGAANAVLIDDPFNNCVGLRADGNSNFAVVTVTYDPPVAPLLPDGSACTDFLYCNGTDTCASGNCDQHTGDPCIGGGECNTTCNEAADNCYDLPPTPCTSDSNPCTVDQCDGAGACAHPAGNAGAECRPDGGQCDVAEQCNGTSPTCPVDGFSPNGTPCSDSNVCTQTDQCNGSNMCVGSNQMDCSDGDVCTADLCDPVDGCDNPGALALDCKDAPKAILILKQNGGAGDKQLFKWVKGEALDQTSELGDPTGTTEYGVCIYSGPGNDLLESFSVPAAGNWDPIGTKGYKYKDSNGAASGLTNVLLKGGAAGKTKVLVKGKGDNLPDPVLTNLPLPVTAQVINPDTGVCVEAVFESGDVKKNTDTLFKAKAQ